MTSISISVCGQALLHGALDLVSPVAAGVGDVLRTSDASLANLEATVAAVGAWPTKTKTLHLTDIRGITSLRALGFDVLTHANNHAFDLGPPGITETRAAVERAGMRLAGSGVNRAAAARAAQIETPHGKVAVLSADLGPSRKSCMRPTIAAASTPFACNAKRSCRHQLTTCCASSLKALAMIGGGGRAAVGYRGEPVDPAGSRCSEQRS